MDIQYVRIQNGNVVWSSKGDPVEINNAIFNTYECHPFNYHYRSNEIFPRHVVSEVEPDLGIKALKTVRGMLTTISRTTFRTEVKKLLFCKTFIGKLDFLSYHSSSEKGLFAQIESFDKNQKTVDLYKDICFSNIQLNAILTHQPVPYTKDDVLFSAYSGYYRLIYKIAENDMPNLDDRELLDSLVHINIDLLKDYLVKDNNGMIQFNGNANVYNVKTESIEYKEK